MSKNSYKNGVTMERSEKCEIITLHRVLFVIGAIALIYKYYGSRSSPMIHIRDPKFGVFGPYNMTETQVEDSYDQLIDIKNFSFLVNPHVCDDYPAGLLLVVIVSSNPSQYENRQVIRNTWGRNTDSTQLVFLLGETDNITVANDVTNEINNFGDIVLGNFKDAYRNLTYKHVMGLKWVAHHCPQAKYVLKTDDDVLVHAEAFKHFLARELSPWGAERLIACHVIEKSPVLRSNETKWLVTVEEYASPNYPDYCPGWAILYSKDVVAHLLKAAQSTPFFWIDDVHITGTLAEKIGVPRTSLSSLILTHVEGKMLVLFGPKHVRPFLIGPYNLGVDKILEIWEAITLF